MTDQLFMIVFERFPFHFQRFQCQCLHNTGGDNCEECLPLFNQQPWRTGGIQGLGCEGIILDPGYNLLVTFSVAPTCTAEISVMI